MDEFDFDFIKDLGETDADVALFFLVPNSVLFTTRLTDLWYRTTKLVGHKFVNVDFNNRVRIYSFNEPALPLACYRRVQFCKAYRCTPLSAFWDALYAVDMLFNGDEAGQIRFPWGLS